MLIDFDKGKEDVVNRKLQRYCRELRDCCEYPLREDYEEPESDSDVYFDYQLYLIDIEGITVVLYFDGGWYSMIAIQFAKDRWHKHDIVRWIDRMGVYFFHVPVPSVEIADARSVVSGVLFRGRPIVVYEKGHQTLSVDVREYLEIEHLHTDHPDFFYFKTSPIDISVHRFH